MGEGARFRIDEEALRQVVLKAYHEKRSSESDQDQRLLEAVREFLAGDIGELGRSTYHFEDCPERSLAEFAATLESTSHGLAGSVATPLLLAIDEATARAAPGETTAPELAPNPSVWLAALAGPVALRHSLDETVVSSLLAATTLGLARLGTSVVRSRLATA